MKKNFTLFIIFAVCNVTLLQAAVPAGYYYNANGKTKAELKTALSEICKRAQMHPFGTGIDATWSLFYQMDQLTDSSVVDMYSNTMRKFDATNPTHSIKEMHIDHAFARECWGGWDIPATFDMHNLFPADGNTNVSKSYYPLGIVTNPTFDNGVSKVGRNDFPTSTGFAFEPADQYKGDFARAYLYISTVHVVMAGRWRSEMSIMGTVKSP